MRRYRNEIRAFHGDMQSLSATTTSTNRKCPKMSVKKLPHLPREGTDLHLVGRLAGDIWMHGYLINHLLQFGGCPKLDAYTTDRASHGFRTHKSPSSQSDRENMASKPDSCMATLYCVRCVVFGVANRARDRPYVQRRQAGVFGVRFVQITLQPPPTPFLS